MQFKIIGEHDLALKMKHPPNSAMSPLLAMLTRAAHTPNASKSTYARSMYVFFIRILGLGYTVGCIKTLFRDSSKYGNPSLDNDIKTIIASFFCVT